MTTFGIDTDKSSLRLYADTFRASTLSAPIQQGAVAYGSFRIFPKGGTFSSVRLQALDVIQQVASGPVNRGTLLGAPELFPLWTSRNSTNPSSATFDFDLTISEAKFQPGNVYYLSAEALLTFLQTGVLARKRFLLPVPSLNQTLRAQNAASLHQRADQPSSLAGLFSQTFRLAAAAVATAAVSSTAQTTAAVEGTLPTTAAASSTSSDPTVGIAIGVAVGAVALVAIIVVAVLLVRRHRASNAHDAQLASPRPLVDETPCSTCLSDNDVGGLM